MQINIVVDKSGSMVGEPIVIAKNIVDSLFLALNNNSVTQNKATVCVIEYNINTALALPVTLISEAKVDISTDCVGPKNLGAAIELSLKQIADSDSRLFVLTKGKPSDIQLFNSMCNEAKTKYKSIYVLHGNMEKSAIYKNITQNIIQWDVFDSSKTIQKIFGGREIVDSNGNELLMAPPPVLDIII